MKITFVLTNASMSGGVRVIAAHARALMRRGHEVLVVSTAPPPLGLRRKVSTFLHGKGWPRVHFDRRSHLDGTGVPHQIIPKFRPMTDGDLPDADIVVATWWETAEWVSRLSPSKGARAYFIQHYENWGGEPARVDATWRLPLQKIAISRWLVDMARERFGDPNVFLVPNSVDQEQFHAPPRGKQPAPTVGTMYATIYFKGCDVALKAVEIAARAIPDLKLASFGSVPLSPKFPLPPGSRYTQSPPQDRIKDIYASCDAWLIGSRSEGFGLPMLEAMACRTPVVSTKVGGPLDMIDSGSNGFLVDVDDSAALAARLVEVLRLSEQQWRQMSDSAYATVCRYTWQDAAALLEQAFEKTIARSPTPRPLGMQSPR